MHHRLVVAAVVVLSLCASPAALASFHFMKIVEVFGGTPAAPNAQYVVLQMYSGGQNAVTGHGITVYDASNAPIGTFAFAGGVPNGVAQDKILIATTEAQTFFSISANLLMTPVLLGAGGKVCFDAIPVDCVAWGAFAGPAAGIGTPFNAPAGLLPGQAAIRRLDIAGAPGTLQSADDTDQCATDFVGGLPAPRNNAGNLGTIPAATCGNDALEGLEQCDDGGIAIGDGCSADCRIEPTVFANGFEGA
jgi:cysteine-rich repeat protein